MTIPDLATIINSASTVVLVVVTAIYAYITHQMFKSAEKNLRFQSKSLKEQLRVQKMPDIFVNLKKDKENIFLEVINVGNNAAHDVDVVAIPVFNNDENSVRDIVSKLRFVKKIDIEKIENNLLDDSFFGAYFRFIHPIFPPNHKNTVNISTKHKHDMVHILIQYRDSLAINYVRVMFFATRDSDGTNSELRLIDIDPIGAKPLKRIDVLKYKSLGKKPEICKQYAFLNEFFDLLKVSISSFHFLQKRAFGVEDVGIWESLKP